MFEGDRAVGVTVVTGASTEVVRGTEVILCAGAVHSPAILQRSGVGPADWLADANVPLRADLPVGQHFQDHPLVSIILELKADAIPPPGFRHTNCCLRYSSGLSGAGPGDMMIVAMNRLGDSLGRGELDNNESGIGMLGVWVNECFATGSLRITSADPHEHPSIEENMLGDERDAERMRDGIRRLAALAEHDAVQAIAQKVYLSAGGWVGGDDDALDLQQLQTLNDGDLDTLALAVAGDAQHATSTCRMGNPDDSSTVVDSQCRVHGFEGLRVADASIMPRVPRANTHLSALMIGEKVAAMLTQA